MAAAARSPVAGEGLLVSVLHEARERGFVGRAAQIRAFDESLRGASDARILFVHGPGGIGKTTLLDAFARRAIRAERSTVYLDARDVSCSTFAVTEAITERAVRAGCAEGDPPDVLLVDGYELLESLDGWFRGEFLPSRPARSVTVLAGRAAPQPTWWLDPGWRRLLLVHELAGLEPAESVDLLARLGVDQGDREAMAGLGRGHPLALVLLAEACSGGSVPAHLADEPDVVGRLCRLIVDDVPDAAHRSGLATCAHATRMTHDLLVHAVGQRADEVWAWLESRPYVRRGAIGMFLHDVVREVFEAEFAHRAPDAYASLHRRVREHFLARLVDPREPRPDRAAAEILMLHRRTPLTNGTDTLREGGLPAIARAAAADHEEIFRLIEQGEGAESAELARRWVREQPNGLYRAHSDDGVVAFAMQVYLPAVGGLLDDDPVARAVRREVDEHGPLRPGERINVNRFAGASGAYQRHPMVLLVNGVSCILEWALKPAAWTFIVTIEDALYGPYFEYLGMSRMFELDYFGQRLVGYGWDRRRFPPTGLFELMARRDLNGETGPPPDAMLRPVPLSQPAFLAAVHDALRHLNRPDRLAESPLLGTELIDPAATEPVHALRLLLVATMAELAAEPRGAGHRRVLERTYLKGAPSQEAAAELLGLPFSTYRRHLARAEERLVGVLWSIEIGVRRLPMPARGEHEVSTQ